MGSFLVLYVIGFNIYISGTVLCAAQNNLSRCFGECSRFQDDLKTAFQNISCTTDLHSCGMQARGAALSVYSDENSRGKDTGAYSSCSVGISVPFHYIFVESISLSHSNNNSFLQVSWNLPSFSPEDDARNFPALWTLKFIADSGICITITFTYESLLQNKGRFSIPCMKTGSNSYQYLRFFYYEGEKDNLQVAQSQNMEIVSLDAVINSTVHPWNSDLSYVFRENFLDVTFTPLPKYSSAYAISIYKTNEFGLCDVKHPPVQKWNGSGILPKTTTSFALENFENCQRYCVQLTVPKTDANCSGTCITHYVDTVYFQRPASVPNCKLWTAAMLIQANSNMDEISVFFNPCCGFEDCFREYNMYLYILIDQDCNEGYEVSYRKFENVFPEVNKLKFHVKELGNYCVRVQPVACEWDFDACTVRNSEIVSILEITHQPVVGFSPGDPKIVIISCMIVISLIVALALGGFFYWRRKRGPFLMVKTSPAKNEDMVVSFRERNGCKISTFVLHTQDLPTKQRVFAMVDVLRKSTNLTIELCDERLCVIVIDGGEEWISTQLQVRNMNNSNRQDAEVGHKRQVIIVESERAVAHQNYHRRMLANDLRKTLDDDDSVTNPLEDTQGIDEFSMQLEHLFVYGLKELMSKEHEALDDYFHLFVVHFTDITPRECKLQRLIPHARYYLPENIVALCTDLESDSCNHSPLQDSEKLRSVIKENPYFSQFMEEIFR